MIRRLWLREFMVTGVNSPMPSWVRRAVWRKWVHRRQSWFLWQADLAFCIVFLGGSTYIGLFGTPETFLPGFVASILLGFSAFFAIYLPAYFRFCGAQYRKWSFCRTCGYDLRASSGRCPECGTPISHKVEAIA